MIESILTGVAASLVASTVFLFVLYKLRPNIEFSPYIANQTKDGDHMYGFKVVNNSRYPATHLEFQLTLITPRAVPGGSVLSNTLIPLTKDKIFEVGGFSKNDDEAHYALRIGTDSNLLSLCKNESQYLYLTVSAQHSLSGFSKVFTKFYNPHSDLKEGKHEFGSGMDVK